MDLVTVCGVNWGILTNNGKLKLSLANVLTCWLYSTTNLQLCPCCTKKDLPNPLDFCFQANKSSSVLDIYITTYACTAASIIKLWSNILLEKLQNNRSHPILSSSDFSHISYNYKTGVTAIIPYPAFKPVYSTLLAQMPAVQPQVRSDGW